VRNMVLELYLYGGHRMKFPLAFFSFSIISSSSR
jgi:hypothetical protein